MQKKYKATLALLISIVGFILSYPYAEAGFLGGILHGGFLAATIGGLADWFAVTALFRRPLGISYRTDILRRNRQRLMQALVDFASDDLLSVKNIMEVVREQNMAQMLVAYFSVRGGRERLLKVLDNVLLAAAAGLDTRAVAQELSPAVRQILKGFPLEHLMQQLIALLKEERRSERLFDVLLQLGRQVIAAPAVQQAILENISVLRTRYEEQSMGRAFVLQALDLSDDKILGIVNDRLEHYFDGLLEHTSTSYEHLFAGFEKALTAAVGNASLERALAEWKCQHIDTVDVTTPIAVWLEQHIKGEEPDWLQEVNRFAEAKMDEFAQKESFQKRYDTLVKDYMERELTAHHDVITRMIRNRLDEFSDDKLVEFVESRIADDVQMIRINGSIVGSLVGMLLFAFVFFMERVYG